MSDASRSPAAPEARAPSQQPPACRRRGLLRGATALAVVLALGGGAGALLPAAQAASPEVGRPAPAFTATDTQGRTVSLDGLRGRTVVLEWTNAECPYVGKHYGADNMQKLQREATAAGVVWLSVISSAPGEQGYADAKEAERLNAERKAAPSAVLLDPEGKLGHLYDARVTPHMFVIGPDGTLRYMGGIDSIPSARAADIDKAEPYLRNALHQVLDGQPVEKAVTRPYGCTVKYAS